MAVANEKRSGNPLIRAIIAFALLIPAMIACFSTLFLPTVNTFLNSLQDKKIFTTTSARFVGLENYTQMFTDRVFNKALGLTFELMLVRMLVVVLVPLLLALAVNELGRRWKIATRLLVTIPLAFFAPVSAALAWGAALNQRTGFVNHALESFGLDPAAWISTPQSAPAVLIFLEGLAAAGIACGVGLTIFLAALRGRGDAPPSGKQILGPLLISWIAGLLAVMVLPLPSFEIPDVLFGMGGPLNSTETLGTYIYRYSILRGMIGYGSAGAVLILCIAIPAGLIIGLLAVLGKARLETVPSEKSSSVFTGEGKPRWRKILFGVLAAWMVLNVISLFVFGLPPILATLSSAADGMALLLKKSNLLLQAYSNTIFPSLLGVVFLQLPIAYLGALGIGAVRPLRKWSEWILLPFVPWLLVTIFPLSLAFAPSIGHSSGADKWTTLIPPIALSVPMLVVLTLFFKGQEPKWRSAQSAGKSGPAAFLQEMILPSLPLAALLAAVALLLNMQEFVWPLIAVSKDTLWPIPVFLFQFHGQYGTDPGLVAAANVILELPVFVFFFFVFGLFNIFYLDRLALVTGDSKSP